MVAVEDQLDDDVVAHERGPGDPRVSVAEGTHGVEEVRHRQGAAVEGDLRLLGRRVGVAARNGDATREEDVDQLERAGELRRQRDEPHRPRVEQPLQQLRIGVAPAFEQVRPHARGGEERAFDVHAEDSRAASGRRHLTERGDERRLRRRDQRREV
jgi:hypothetical protein